jgi:hypothetical protein
MLTGRRIFDGDDPRSVAQAHLTTPIPQLRDLRPGVYAPSLDKLLRRITAREPQQRPQSAAELGQAIDQFRANSNRETQRFVVAERTPTIRERAARVVPALAEAEPVRTRAPRPAVHRSAQRRRGFSIAPLIGLLVLCLVVAGCSLFGFNAILDRWQQGGSVAVELPELPSLELPDLGNLLPDIGLPDLSGYLPEWLTGVVAGEGPLMVVTIGDSEGLNVRAAPGLQGEVIGFLPNGTVVRQVGGPQSADQIEWYPIRAQIGDREVEGWVSAGFVRVVQ